MDQFEWTWTVCEHLGAGLQAGRVVPLRVLGCLLNLFHIWGLIKRSCTFTFRIILGQTTIKMWSFGGQES